MWTLRVRQVTLSDGGDYECQVNTQPEPLRRVVNVKIVKAEIEVGPDAAAHLDEGSRLALNCAVHSGGLTPQFILWYVRIDLCTG